MNKKNQRKIKKCLYILLKNISGFYIYQLLDYLNIFLVNKNLIDKGLFGKLIENYIIDNKNKGKICDLNFLNLEFKTISLNNLGVPINDVLLMSFKLFNFFQLKFKNFFFLKIKKILWIPIFGKRKTFFLYKIIGDCFITYLSKYNIYILLNELKKNINYILNNDFVLNNYYSKNFRLQLFLLRNKKKVFNNYYVRLYLNKYFLTNIFSKK